MAVRWTTAALAAAAAFTLSACTFTSDGLELRRETPRDQVAVSFEWRSTDDVSGTLTATVPDGRVFGGPYVWMTAETPTDLLQPLWQGWSGDHAWRHWQPGPGFAEHYRGEILANLRAANGDRMRCRFKSMDHSSGMASGGKGTCQLAGGNTFDAVFASVRAG
jgi:hypothetical protein